MQDRPRGGFYSSLDADSEGHEGKFYVWTRERCAPRSRRRVRRVFSRASASIEAPNFEGTWHLHVFGSIEQIATEAEARTGRGRSARSNSARAKLLAIRSQRVWPGRDDKILTSLERAHDSRHGRCGARARARRFRRSPPIARSDFIRKTLGVDGPPARHVQGRARASQCLPRRLRVSRRCDSRAAAAALPQRRAGLRARAPRGDAGALRGRASSAASSSPPTITRR